MCLKRRGRAESQRARALSFQRLWPPQHLRPQPYNHSHNHGIATLRILGKLGGRNRRMLKEPRQLTFEVSPNAYARHFIVC